MRKQYISKSAVVEKIERLISIGQVVLQESQESNDYEGKITWLEHITTCKNILDFLDTLETKELEEDEDYRVEYTDNLNAGDARVTISGMGNYSGYVEKPFRIEAKSISEAKLFLEETVYLCDGAEKCPRVTVTDGETELKKGTDYDVAYKNNTDVGIATVMISGKGNYSGSVSETFEIIMLGDVNADGRVDINDATLVQKAVAELVVLDEKQQKAADVTGDGKITIDDATLIQKYVAELIDHFG